MATAVVAHPICAMVLPDEPMRVFAQRLSVCLIGYAQRNFCVSYSGTGRQILSADVSGFVSMIQNPTPVAGGGKNNHGLALIQTVYTCIRGRCPTSDIQTSGLNLYGGSIGGNLCDIIGVAISISVFCITYVPPRPGF